MKTSVARLAVATAAVALAATACGSSDDDDTSNSSAPAETGSESSTPAATEGIPDGPIKIGLPLGLSGFIALYDGDVLVGAQMAAKEINDAGGIDGHQIEILTADTKSDIAQGGAAALEVIDQGAQFIIPTIDYDFGGGAAREAMNHDLLAISMAGDLRYGLSIGPYMFNLYGAAPNEAAVLAQFAKDQNYDSVYILTDTSLAHETAVCGAFKELMAAHDIEVAGEGTFEQADTSIATQVTEIRSMQDDIDAVMLCSYPPGGASALRQLRSGGITVPFLLDQPYDSNSWQEAVPDPGEVYIVSVGVIPPGENPDKASADLYAKYTEFTGKPVQNAPGLLNGYSAVYAIADGIKATGSVDAAAITKHFETYVDEPLAFGATTWTADCHVAEARPMQIATVEDGKLQYLTTIDPTTLPEESC